MKMNAPGDMLRALITNQQLNHFTVKLKDLGLIPKWFDGTTYRRMAIFSHLAIFGIGVTFALSITNLGSGTSIFFGVVTVLPIWAYYVDYMAIRKLEEFAFRFCERFCDGKFDTDSMNLPEAMMMDKMIKKASVQQMMDNNIKGRTFEPTEWLTYKKHTWELREMIHIALQLGFAKDKKSIYQKLFELVPGLSATAAMED